jgi:hypothetical protein
MNKIMLDDTLRARLNGLNEAMEFCDESGRAIGHFLPADLYNQILYSADFCPYTEEEIQESLQEPLGRPLAEIWKSLGQG